MTSANGAFLLSAELSLHLLWCSFSMHLWSNDVVVRHFFMYFFVSVHVCRRPVPEVVMKIAFRSFSDVTLTALPVVFVNLTTIE